MKPLYIYNLYPRLYKNIKKWEEEIEKIMEMGFNSIFLNPFHKIGFSGSLYAVKDYYGYNEEFFIDSKNCEKELKAFLDTCHKNKLSIFMDLVVNHSSIDSVLLKDHKDWYNLTEDGDFKHPGAWKDGKWVTWGDLTSFNFDTSSDKMNLWDYFLNLCRHYLNLGFNGFRCDAAYQVNSEFWIFLISNLKKEYSNVLFLAETLGCTPVQIQSLSTCGFDYIFNSSKWWNYNDPWCLEQYDLTRTIAPSISFPETHDTNRLMDEVDGDETAFLQRLYFEAVFSKGFMIASGFEYGFKKHINTVKTTYKDWENTGLDYSKNIKKILDIKKSLEPLHEESMIKIIEHDNWVNVFVFTKTWNDKTVLICLNKDLENKQKLTIKKINKYFNKNNIRDYSPGKRISSYIENLDFEMRPGEIKIFASEKDL